MVKRPTQDHMGVTRIRGEKAYQQCSLSKIGRCHNPPGLRYRKVEGWCNHLENEPCMHVDIGQINIACETFDNVETPSKF